MNADTQRERKREEAAASGCTIAKETERSARGEERREGGGEGKAAAIRLDFTDTGGYRTSGRSIVYRTADAIAITVSARERDARHDVREGRTGREKERERTAGTRANRIWQLLWRGVYRYMHDIHARTRRFFFFFILPRVSLIRASIAFFAITMICPGATMLRDVLVATAPYMRVR